MHRQYLWPAADIGSIGPTTSIVILWKAVSSLGIGVIGTLSITKLLAFNWHFSQDLQNLSIFRLISGVSSVCMAQCTQCFCDSSLFCSSSNFGASALCITCSPSSSASSNRLAIGNPLSLMSSSLSSDPNKLSISDASFSCLILSDVILDSSSLVSSLSLSFSFFPSSSLTSS